MPNSKASANGAGHSSAVRVAVLEREVEGVKERMDDLETTVKEGFRAVGEAGRDQTAKIDRLLSKASNSGKISWPQVGVMAGVIVGIATPVVSVAAFYVNAKMGEVQHQVEMNAARRDAMDAMNRMADEAAWVVLQTKIDGLPRRPGATP